MHNLITNCIISPSPESALFDSPVRLLELDSARRKVIVIEYTFSPKKPWAVELDPILIELGSETLRILPEQSPDFLVRHDDEISEQELQSRERRWNLVRDLVEGRSVGELLAGDCFGARVSAHARAVGVDRKQIYRLLFRYWSMGQVKNAFLHNSTNWGKAKDRKVTPGQRLGRPPKYLGVVHEDRAIQLCGKDLSAIKLAYDRFASGKCGKVRDAWDWMLNKFYTKVLPGGFLGDIDRGSYPTLSQFKYHGKKFFDAMYVLKGRRGAIRWNKDYRSLTGSASDGVFGPCHRFEIDSTIADMYLVHRANRNWLIGRPVLYVVVDNFSRMIVGVHVGLEGPSWNGARHALFNAYTPKQDFCKRYNVEITEDEWPCHHLPFELSADRAELLSEAGEAMSNSLGTILKIAPPFRPDWKAIVESRFRLINEGLDLKFTPGGVDARRLERGDRDYELDAILDIDQFTEMIILAVLNHNRNLRLPHLLNAQMVAAEVDPTPLGIWRWALEHSPIHARTKGAEELKIALLPSREASIRRGGIYFQGLLFTCEILQREQWAEHSHNGSTRYVRVWYDPNCVDSAWVKIGADFHPLTLAPHMAQKFSGYRLEEIQDLLSKTKQVSPDAAYQATQDRVNLKKRSEEIVTEAARMKKEAGKPPSKAEFKRDKHLNRQAEVRVERARDVVELKSIHSGLTASPESASEPICSERTALSSRGRSFLKLVTGETKGGGSNE
jgi:putative transposase